MRWEKILKRSFIHMTCRIKMRFGPKIAYLRQDEKMRLDLIVIAVLFACTKGSSIYRFQLLFPDV